jgi:hypothetical protein
MATCISGAGNLLLLLVALAGFRSASGVTPLSACTPGEETCPVVLKMKPGTSAIVATGSVSGEQPDYYVTFVAKAGQKITVHTVGGGLKTGPGIPISGPGGMQDAVDEDTPFTLPSAGAYVLDLHANTMSDGPFGRFTMTLKIN